MFKTVLTKGSKRFPAKETEYQARVVPGKSITIRKEYKGQILENQFTVGDQAEYHSWNLSYYGEIVAITEKTVTIQEQYSTKKHRLDLYKFAWRNIRFNVNKAAKENSETMMYI